MKTYLFCEKAKLYYNCTMIEEKKELNPENMPHEKESIGSFLWEIIKFTAIAVLIVVPIRVYIAQPYIVSGSSMDPTFHNGDYLIVDQLSYRLKGPERGDVVIFRFPQNPSQFFIKRIIGLPGETVVLDDGASVIQSNEYPGGFTLKEPYVRINSNDIKTVSLGDGEYFVMGDNRGASFDSRSWGALPEDLLVGRALVRLLPISKAAVLPGEYKISATSDMPARAEEK